MAYLTRAQIISEGLLRAGDDSLSDRALVWFNTGLKNLYKGWPFPFLKVRVDGVALATAARSINFGVGSGGVSTRIHRVFDPVYIYDSTYSTRGEARVRQLLNSNSIATDQSVNDPTKNIGRPTTITLRESTATEGQWVLWLDPVPDRAYLAAIDYWCIPDNLANGSAIPRYPNDETIIKMITSKALDHLKHELANDALQKFEASAASDRVDYGQTTGDGDLFQMDGQVFK